MGYVPFVTFKVQQLGVEVGVFQLSVSEHLLDVFYVFCSVVFHGCFPMAERMEVDLF